MSAKIWIVGAEHHGESGHRDAIYGAHPDEFSAKQHAVLVDVSPVPREESRGAAFVFDVDLLNAFVLGSDVLKRVFDALWDTQWAREHVTGNIVCAYGYGCCQHTTLLPCGHRRYDSDDQIRHDRDCKFVTLWADLRSDRLAVGEVRELEVAI